MPTNTCLGVDIGESRPRRFIDLQAYRREGFWVDVDEITCKLTSFIFRFSVRIAFISLKPFLDNFREPRQLFATGNVLYHLVLGLAIGQRFRVTCPKWVLSVKLAGAAPQICCKRCHTSFPVSGCEQRYSYTARIGLYCGIGFPRLADLQAIANLGWL